MSISTNTDTRVRVRGMHAITNNCDRHSTLKEQCSSSSARRIHTECRLTLPTPPLPDVMTTTLLLEANRTAPTSWLLMLMPPEGKETLFYSTSHNKDTAC